MIELIKHGKEKYSVVATRCPECGCIFKFTPSEDTYHVRALCEDRIDCPDCGCAITVFDTSFDNDDPDHVLCEIIECDDLNKDQ